MCGTPLTAEKRPLFFRHTARVPKGDLTEEQWRGLVEFECGRAVEQEKKW